MGKIYLIRHGETEWNREHRSQGCSNDIPLSEEGRMQAKLAAEKLEDRKIDFFYSSGLSRAKETAEIIAEKHLGKVQVCNEFIEINFGEWEGMTFPEIKKYYNDIFAIWRRNPEKAAVPGAESLESIKKRSMTKLIELAEMHKESNILIVSHGITAKVMIASMLNMSLSNIHNIKQDNTAINIFNYTDNKFEVECLNDICHLESLTGEVSSFEMK